MVLVRLAKALLKKLLEALRYGPKASKSVCASVQQFPSKVKLNSSLRMLHRRDMK